MVNLWARLSIFCSATAGFAVVSSANTGFADATLTVAGSAVFLFGVLVHLLVAESIAKF